MQRPAKVQEAITVTRDGLHVGHYGDYVLYSAYQPIYRVSENHAPSIPAFEGLIRPFLGDTPIDPSAFFRLVDDEDLLFVECMCQALHVRNHHRASPAGGGLFVNVNPAIYTSISMLEREFNFLLSNLSKHGLETTRVIIELLETAPYSSVVLKWLRRMALDNGIQFAMDDFGRSHSCLERYESLKPDIVKVDRGVFLKAAQENTHLQTLQSAIERFRGDGALVIIEGIETAEQLDLAQNLGADFFQGYYLHYPQILPYDFASNHNTTGMVMSG